jgi:hypothetical protein
MSLLFDQNVSRRLIGLLAAESVRGAHDGTATTA